MKSGFQFGVIVALFFAVVTVTVTQHAAQWKDCGSVGSETTKVIITPCDSDPCKVTPGKTSSISIFFKAKEGADNLTAEVYGSVGPVRVPYKLPQPDACKKSNLTCPLVKGKDYDYVFSFQIPSPLPHVDVVVELDLMVNKEKYMCIDFPVEVTPPSDANIYKGLVKNLRYP